MRVARTVAELRDMVTGAAGDGRIVGLVPTMGALHDGHLSLLRAARSECDVVVLSIFVNPLQFAPTDDLAQYPRTEARDLELAEMEKVDIVFVPPVTEMYREGSQVSVRTGRLGQIVEGAARPGHFDGVATVVAKLFNQVRPDKAFFGQKDAQQVAVVKRLVVDLDFPIKIIVGPTVREADGLALSSRNVYLSPEQRTRATLLWRALQRGREVYEADGSTAEIEAAMAAVVTREEGMSLDYALAVDPQTFEPPSDAGPPLLVIAARVGATRLIDNFQLTDE
ncbi:MAG TPA: pantoate--beta-alanine ligase [Actinomycetota bacterium]|nr:pantoate--beta-alanine ligase [Actinomycetota bacterium]